MNIKLLNTTPLYLAALAIRQSRDITDKSDSIYVGDSYKLGEKDAKLIDTVGNKFKHKSVLEQAVMTWEIKGISRGCLQELARHRTARLTVKSSRYTLQELKNEAPFMQVYGMDESLESIKKRASKYIVLIDEISSSQLRQLEELRIAIYKGIKNDIAKYLLPESYKTNLVWQIDLRNFQNFLELRTANSAHWEIRKLAYGLYDSLPQDYQDLCVRSLQ